MSAYYYQYRTRHGTVRLMPEPTGRWQVVFDSQNLGSYASPQMAADDVSGGHTDSPSVDFDFDELDIPYDLGEWEKVRVSR